MLAKFSMGFFAGVWSLQAVCPSVLVSVIHMAKQDNQRTDEPNLERMDVEQALHELLVQYADRGVPELVLLGVLREQARAIERHGYLPRRYASRDLSHLDL